MTREALPRLDNYRNILSVHVGHRPTLDELHNNTIHEKVCETNTQVTLLISFLLDQFRRLLRNLIVAIKLNRLFVVSVNEMTQSYSSHF